MSGLIIDHCKDLFKDDESFNQFVKILSEQLNQDFSLIISNEEVLGAVLSSASAKEVIYERMIKAVSKSPEILDEIKDRIENDEIVD